MHKTIAALSVALLTACAMPQPPVWAKPGATATDASNTMAECRFQAAAATQSTDPTLRGGLAAEVDRGIRRNDLLRLCMLSRGYKATPG